MRLTPTTMKIPDGEVGGLMTEHLEEEREGCHLQFRG
jgi:hypothetical protein